MPLRIEPNAEPLPGYKLIERLGGGGFGEVWKAEVPGGLFKAIKFVYGDMDQFETEESSRADQEFKALNRVKSLQHPYLLNLERIENIDGQLVIVMELAHRTLWDRYRESRAQGLPGIPREELLGYMEETSEALDLMNQQYQLQHLDIKPQNLFLVHNHIKVADFGLVKDLEGKAATVTGGVTPVYAAPETFDGWVSRFSDQYSLAIVYQEMLTGTRPFSGTTMRQLVLQHLQTSPDLSPLPVADRSAVARALSKNPEDRYLACKDFCKALRAAQGTKVQMRPSSAEITPVPTPPEEPAEDVEVTRDAHGKIKRPAPAPQEVLDYPPQIMPPRPAKPQPAAEPEGSVRATEIHTLKNRHPAQLAPARPPAPGTADGIVQPALLIGLGRFGVETLRVLRKLVAQEFGSAHSPQRIRFLGIDTDPEQIQYASNRGEEHAQLRPSEILQAKLHRPSYYLKEKAGQFNDWLNSKLLYRIPKQINQAGARALGRLAWIDNHRYLWRRLEMELEACLAEGDTEQDRNPITDLGVRSHSPRIYVISSMFGTTGSGMFIDVAYAARVLLRKMGFGGSEVVGLCFLPPNRLARTPGIMQAQTFAALSELQYFSSGNTTYTIRYPGDGTPNSSRTLAEAGPPLKRCYLLNLNSRSQGNFSQLLEGKDALQQAGHFLYRDLFTPLGQAIDKLHHKEDPIQASTPFYSFGLYRLFWPRRQLLEAAGRKWCQQLVDHWMNKNAAPIKQEVKSWVEQQWEAHGFRIETMIQKFQERCERLLKKGPDQMIAEVLTPAAKILEKPPAPAGSPDEPRENSPWFSAVVPALDQIEKLLGLPEELRNPQQHVEPGEIERALAEVTEAAVQEGEQILATLVVRLLEEPQYRLAGAEEAIRQFNLVVQKALESQEPLLAELRDRSAKLFQLIARTLDNPAPAPAHSTPFWKGAFKRHAPTSHPGLELLELLRTYPKTLFQHLVLTHIAKLYVSLRGLLSDQLREVGFCRQRLGELHQLLEPKVDPIEDLKTNRHSEKVLFSQNCPDFQDALKKLLDQVSGDQLLAFDNQIQELVRRKYQALLNVCLESSSVVRELSGLMLQEAQKVLEGKLNNESVAEIFIAQHSQDDHLLHEYFDEAASDLGKASKGNEQGVIVIPSDQAGKELQNTLRKALPPVQTITSSRSDEVVFYREQRQNLAELEYMDAAALELFQQKNLLDPGCLLSREDLPNLQPDNAACS